VLNPIKQLSEHSKIIGQSYEENKITQKMSFSSQLGVTFSDLIDSCFIGISTIKLAKKHVWVFVLKNIHLCF